MFYLAEDFFKQVCFENSKIKDLSIIYQRQKLKQLKELNDKKKNMK